MQHHSTRDVVNDLKNHGKLIVVDEPLHPRLEIAEVQRRVYARGGPAVLFTNPIGTSFPMVSNLFGSLEQARFLFRGTLERVRRAIELKIDPNQLFKDPLRYLSAPWTAWNMLPRPVSRGPVLHRPTSISQLPQLISWPDDGGPFVTLPQVISQPCSPRAEGKEQASAPKAKLTDCNLGMYRIQLNGNSYAQDREIGLHYQLHRGIGIHHQSALQANQPFRVAVTVGGTPP